MQYHQNSKQNKYKHLFEFYLNIALILLIQITDLEHATSQKKTSTVGYKMGARSQQYNINVLSNKTDITHSLQTKIYLQHSWSDQLLDRIVAAHGNRQQQEPYHPQYLQIRFVQ
jgi:exopolysaccharide biosynthesis protein